MNFKKYFMKYDLIQTKNYLLVVSNVFFDRGHFLVTPDRSSVVRIREVIDSESLLIENTPFTDKDGLQEFWFNECKNSTVIAHLPLGNSPILGDVDLLPPLPSRDHDYISSLAKGEIGWYDEHDNIDVSNFIKGYNKAKEEYKYTEEDINIMVNNTLVFAESNTHLSVGEYATQFKDFYDKCIQSLSQLKMPIEFECNVEIDEKIDPISTGNYPSPEDYYYRPKIKITEHGYNQWVGRYIFR